MTDARSAGQLSAAASQAAKRRDWTQACQLWRECLDEFPTSPHAFSWRNGLGNALIESGHYADAGELYCALLDERPAVPIGRLGLARLMQRQRRWSDALAHWDALISQFGTSAEPHWPVRRAAVLVELGRYDDAEQALIACAEHRESRFACLAGLAALAMRRAWWPEALCWWEMLRQEAGTLRTPDEIAQWAIVLAELGQAAEADQLLRDLARHGEPDIHVQGRMASVMVRIRQWNEALQTVDALLRRNPGELPQRQAEAVRARALFGSGRPELAEPILRNHLPGQLGALCHLLMHAGRHREALDLIEGLAARLPERPDLLAARLGCLMALGQVPLARTLCIETLDRTGNPAVLQSLMDFIAPLFEGTERTGHWRRLQQRVEHIGTLRHGTPNPTLAAVRLRLMLALRNYDEFLAGMERIADTRTLGIHRTAMLAVARTLRSRPFPDHDRPRIFGIGLAKTGTTSLASALAELGYVTLDWFNRLTGELICDDDLHLFDAFTDTPVCLDFERNFERYPNAKFIYTVRPLPDWQRSLEAHLQRTLVVSGYEEARQRITDRDAVRYGTRYGEIWSSLFFRHGSYSEAYQAYDRRVRRFFVDERASRFLEFDLFAGDGWAKLCAFLGRDVPAVPFPWDNRRPAPAPTAAGQ